VNIYNHKSIINFWLILLLFISTNLSAGERVLESISVIEEQGYSIIDIKLNAQLTVSSHAPLKSGNELRLKVKKTASARQEEDEDEVTQIETLPWKVTRKVPLYEIEMDLNDAAIILRFKQSVNFRVRGGNNAFHIFVEVIHSDVGAQKQVKPIEEEIKQHTIKGAENPELAKVMVDARTAMLAKDYSIAIQQYTKIILDHSKSIYAQEALEYLGLARERKGQSAHAKVAYKKYLKLYPKGEGADRVMQRLAGIMTARAEPKEKLRKGKRITEEKSDYEWSTFGSVSQFYTRRESKKNDDPSKLGDSSLQNNLDITSRMRSQDYQFKGRFSGSYEDNLETSEQDKHRISSFYADFEYTPFDSALRLGRQSRSTGGVLGRFDGLLLSVPAMDSVKLNIVAGYSVESSRDVFINNNTYFYGISADLGTYFNALDFNVFFIEQINQGILDRRAVGGEIRFFQANRSFFTFLDYDIHHDELNTFLFTGQYVFPDRTTINASFDHRKTPILLTSNALIGLSDNDINKLRGRVSDSELLQLAKDRTGTTNSFNLGISRPLTEKFQINADFRWTHNSGTSASLVPSGTELEDSEVIAASESTGDEYAYSTDLTANSLFASGDLYTFGVRYRDSQANTTTFTLNVRHPITRDLRINPRFQYILHDNEDGTTRQTYEPSVRLTYRILRHLQLEVEGGGEWENEERFTTTGTEIDRTKGYYAIVGYRLDF
jgi:TolA-binding protein